MRATIVAQIEHVLITDCQGKQSGDRIMALCPSHDDHNPSMSWSVSKQVWKCFACGAGGGYIDLARLLKIELPKLEKAIETEVGRWLIKDVDGSVIGTHVRKELPNGEKRFIWIDHNGVSSKDMPLYGSELIPQFDRSEPVYVTEGAGKCDELRKLGVQVVASVTGASTTPSRERLSVLDGFDVALWPDNDDPGRSHMRRLAVGLSEEPLWLTWPDAPIKGDAADFVEQGGTSDLLLELHSEATSPPAPLLSENAVPFSLPVGVREEGTASEELDISSGIFDAAGIMRYQAPPVQWQWDDRIPVGGFALVASKPKVGKSQLLLGLALATSRGENFLDWATRQGPVLYLAFEGHIRDVTNRLKLMGLRSEDHLYVRVAPPPVFDGQGKSIFTDWLEPLINEFNPVLVIVDTLFRMLPGVADANDYSLVNRAMSPLEYIARRTEVAIVVSHHANKGNENSDDPGQTILGSTAILGAVDTALVMRRRKGADGATPGRELMSIQREGESLEAIVISLDDSGWPTNSGRAQDFAVDAAKQRIKDVLIENEGEELGAGDLQERTGVKGKTYSNARKALLDSGEIVVHQRGKYKFYSHVVGTE